ncbi:hypothetical protein [Archangium minus]|uniref:hypothetical protein n=1 Tax=Archangium minus TaxID=83450 RepID=UPI0037C0E78F
MHKQDSQVCILGEGGEVVLEQRVRTQRERLGELLSKRSRARVLLEASTELEWVARCLEELGHEVVVADPDFAPMYATRSRRVDGQEGRAHPGGGVQVGGIPARAPLPGRLKAEVAPLLSLLLQLNEQIAFLVSKDSSDSVALASTRQSWRWWKSRRAPRRWERCSTEGATTAPRAHDPSWSTAR